MYKKIFIYLTVFAFSLIFSINSYAETTSYEVEPSELSQVLDEPTTFALNDYKNGYFDNHLDDVTFQGKNVNLLYDNDTKVIDVVDNPLTINFKKTISVNSFYISTIVNDNGSKPEGVNIYFYDVDNVLLKSYSFITQERENNAKSLYINFSVRDVSKIIISSIKNKNGYVSEFELFADDFVYYPVKDITSTSSDTSVSFNWKFPSTSNSIDYVRFDGKDIGKSTAYLLKNLTPDSEYNSNIDIVYKDGTVVTSEYSYKTEKEKDITPPSEVNDFKSIVDTNFVNLSWVLPSDKDYSKSLLYRDGVLIKTFTNETSYTDLKLSEDTLYKYKIVTVDKSGNKSDGSTIMVLTKFTYTNVPPDPVGDLVGKSLSQGVRLNWVSPKSNVKGFEIYMIKDGVETLLNKSLVTSTSYQVSNLKNGENYKFYVLSVNSSNLKSERSKIVSVTPSISSVPPISISGGTGDSKGFSLSDISSGTSNWFGSLWMILAFCIGIPLAFIIGRRVKSLFLG